VATNLRVYACLHGTAHSAADLHGLFAMRRIRWVPSRTFPEEGYFIDVKTQQWIEGCLLAYYLRLRRKGGRP
jgi:hypothetical protein